MKDPLKQPNLNRILASLQNSDLKDIHEAMDSSKGSIDPVQAKATFHSLIKDDDTLDVASLASHIRKTHAISSQEIYSEWPKMISKTTCMDQLIPAILEGCVGGIGEALILELFISASKGDDGLADQILRLSFQHAAMVQALKDRSVTCPSLPKDILGRISNLDYSWTAVLLDSSMTAILQDQQSIELLGEIRKAINAELGLQPTLIQLSSRLDLMISSKKRDRKRILLKSKKTNNTIDRSSPLIYTIERDSQHIIAID